jgi:glycosyltransferase involved in cell wall biosynthesis
MKTAVLIIDSLVTGGAEVVNVRLAKMFVQNGWQVHLVVLKNKIEIKVDKDIRLHTLHYKKRTKLLNDSYYAKQLDAELQKIKKIDLIIGSLGLSHKLMSLIDKRYDFYYAIHGTLSVAKLDTKKGIRRFLKKRELLRLYDDKKLITVSDGVKEDLLTLGIRPKSIQTIYNPFDFKEIRNKAQEEINILLPEKYIVHVGRFSKVKRHDILIKAFALLEDLSWSLVLVGEGEEKENSKKLVQELKLQDRVVFVGQQKNPYPIIKNAALLVLSSESEGFGNVLVEALVLDTLAISVECPFGPKEILRDSRLLVQKNNIIELSEKIKQQLYKRSSTTTDSFDLQRFDQNKIFNQYKKLL